MEGLEVLLSWQFIAFGLSISALVLVFRRVIEYLIQNNNFFKKESKLWTSLILPILPVFLGPLGAYFLKSYPYPEMVNTPAGRFAFGLIAGLMSGLIYRVVKGLVFSKIPDNLKQNFSTDILDNTDK